MTKEEVIEKIKKRIEAPFQEVFGEQIDFDWNYLEIRKTPTTDLPNCPLLERINYNLYITIYYPEITIINSMGLSHNLKGLYVQIWLNKKEAQLYTFSGLRSTYSQKEWVSDYCHSHLPGICTNFSRTFCTNGSDDLLDTLKHTQKHLGYLSVMDVYLLKEQLQAYLSWESIEGVPYRNFRDVGLLRQYTQDFSFFPTFSDLGDKNLLSFPYPIKINKDFKIKNKEEIAKFIIQKVKERQAICPIIVKIGNRFYTENGGNFNVSWEEKELFKFRGNPVYLKVIEDDSVNQYDYYPRLDYLEAVCIYWERQIKMDFKESYIKDKMDKFKDPEYINTIFSNNSLSLQENVFNNDYIPNF